jgi:hypothetical protein
MVVAAHRAVGSAVTKPGPARPVESYVSASLDFITTTFLRVMAALWSKNGNACLTQNVW